jgi:hypothetical protein
MQGGGAWVLVYGANKSVRVTKSKVNCSHSKPDLFLWNPTLNTELTLAPLHRFPRVVFLFRRLAVIEPYISARRMQAGGEGGNVTCCRDFLLSTMLCLLAVTNRTLNMASQRQF